MKIRYTLFALSCLLPLYNMSYLLQAWRSSRLDRFDWLFYLLALPALLWVLRETKFEKWDKWAVLTLLPSLFLAFGKGFHHTHALSVIGCAGAVWSMGGLLGSWRFAWRTLPVLLILLLGTPSSTYQLSLVLKCPVWGAMAVKVFLALTALGAIGLNSRKNFLPEKGSVFFCGALLLSLLFLLHTEELYFTGRSFIPEFPLQQGNFAGRTLEADANTKRFFATSYVKLYRYLNTKENREISVLAVKCGKDIHEIHPASHCLRTSLWKVASETIFYLSPDFAVTEIEAERGNVRMLVWVWYTGDTFSTPSFLGFRRRFTPRRRFYTYQISTLLSGDGSAERKLLKEFMTSLQRSFKK